MKRRLIPVTGLLVAFGLTVGCTPGPANTANSHQVQRSRLTLVSNVAAAEEQQPRPADPVLKLSEEEWRGRLTPEQYHVMREEGTEPAWSGEYNKLEDDGIYRCAACGHPLFSSETKYESGTGWPSFFQPLSEDAVGTRIDNKLSSPRLEVHCANCGGHLGHIFNDGPRPTGKRYCVNSVSLKFDPAASTDDTPAETEPSE